MVNIGICFESTVLLYSTTMTKLFNYSLLRNYKLPARKGLFKYLDLLFVVVFFLLLITQVLR